MLFVVVVVESVEYLLVWRIIVKIVRNEEVPEPKGIITWRGSDFGSLSITVMTQEPLGSPHPILTSRYVEKGRWSLRFRYPQW